MNKQDCKVFIGGLSWETTDQKLRAYFENYGAVHEAFVSYDRNTGRPRGFGFVVFESSEVADKVVSTKHTIDRREVEAKKAVPKEDYAGNRQPNGSQTQKTRKIFVGGLAPSVDEKILKQYFEQYGPVEDAVVMYDHDNKRPRGFGFISFQSEESVDNVFTRGVMQTLHDKQVEVKPAVPRDQMPPMRRGNHFQPNRGGYMGRGPAFAGPVSHPVQYRGQNTYPAGGSTPDSYGSPGNFRAVPANIRPNMANQVGSTPLATYPQQISPPNAGRFPSTVQENVPQNLGNYGVGSISTFQPALGPQPNSLLNQASASGYNFPGFQQPMNGVPNSLQPGVPSSLQPAHAGFASKLPSNPLGEGLGPSFSGFSNLQGSYQNQQFNPFVGSQNRDAGFGAQQEGRALRGGNSEFATETVNLSVSAGFTYGDSTFSASPAPGWSS